MARPTTVLPGIGNVSVNGTGTTLTVPVTLKAGNNPATTYAYVVAVLNEVVGGAPSALNEFTSPNHAFAAVGQTFGFQVDISGVAHPATFVIHAIAIDTTDDVGGHDSVLFTVRVP
jgi:hypothetical protein